MCCLTLFPKHQGDFTPSPVKEAKPYYFNFGVSTVPPIGTRTVVLPLVTDFRNSNEVSSDR
jgi:hypothetical protein